MSYMQSLGIENHEAVDFSADMDVAYQKWVGKDYYNPFIKDFIELDKPHEGKLNAGRGTVSPTYMYDILWF